MDRVRVAVVGAGASGLALARWLRHEGVDHVVFERSAHLGGVWAFDESLPDGGGAAYRSLSTNTSRQVTAFSDFPLAATLPDFPHRSSIAGYLEDYAVAHRTTGNIRLKSEVESVQPAPEGRWNVRTRSPDGTVREEYDAVVVCSGINWDPLIPDYAGLHGFRGRVMHSKTYVDAHAFRGKNVLVVGMGSSAADIASEVAAVTRSVLVSTRSGAWIVPRTLDGQPFDHRNTRLVQSLPEQLRVELLRRRLSREYRRRGWESLATIWSSLPSSPPRGRTTTSDFFLPRVRSGDIRVVPGIDRIDAGTVIFTDGTRARPDTIIFCTGYTRRFPFLGDTVRVRSDSTVDLYRHVFHPDIPTLAFAGMCRVAGAVLPIVELQARWIARVLRGAARLPLARDMHTHIRRRRALDLRRRVTPMRVSFLKYADEIAREIGAEPHPWRHPELALPLLTGLPAAAQFRLDGPATLTARQVLEAMRGQAG